MTHMLMFHHVHRGLHFLVVQRDPDSEDSKGLWLLLEKELPSI